MIDRVFVCPMPGAWDRVYKELWRVHAGPADAGPPPPVPLILAAWAYSSDADKLRRWQDTRRCADLVGRASQRRAPHRGPEVGIPKEASWCVGTGSRRMRSTEPRSMSSFTATTC